MDAPLVSNKINNNNVDGLTKSYWIPTLASRNAHSQVTLNAAWIGRRDWMVCISSANPTRIGDWKDTGW